MDIVFTQYFDVFPPHTRTLLFTLKHGLLTATELLISRNSSKNVEFTIFFVAILLFSHLVHRFHGLFFVLKPSRHQIRSNACVKNFQRRWLFSLMWSNLHTINKDLKKVWDLDQLTIHPNLMNFTFFGLWFKFYKKIILKNFALVLISDATLETSRQNQNKLTQLIRSEFSAFRKNVCCHLLSEIW